MCGVVCLCMRWGVGLGQVGNATLFYLCVRARRCMPVRAMGRRLGTGGQCGLVMAAAQVLKATHTVNDSGRVRGVADIALSVDNRVASVGDQVQGVDDKVKAVMDGAHLCVRAWRRMPALACLCTCAWRRLLYMRRGDDAWRD